MRYNNIERDITRSMGSQISVALIVCVLLVFGLGGVAAFAEISGAVIGSGKLIMEGRAKDVQHADGGIVADLMVKEGDKVEAGQVLFRLNGTMAMASLAMIDAQLEQLLAQEARLLAEQARAETAAYPEELLNHTSKRVQVLLSGQDALLKSRQQGLRNRKAQLSKQIDQQHEQIAALRAQQDAVAENLALLEEQIADFSVLHERGLLVDSELLKVQRERASLAATQASVVSEIAEIRQAITQTELQRVQIEEEFDERILTELDKKRGEIAQLREERITAMDRLNRLDIRAPRAGYLHELNVHTIGQIVSQGETLVSIIPADDELIVEAKLSPTDVDQVRGKQRARIRFTGLDQRVTPELFASIIDVSPDLMTDEQTGTSYYVARLRIGDNELAKANAEDLRPGMPVEVFVETGMRTILSYLMKPLTDQISHAMREG